ncbi:pyridoxal phosphate-dependent aminotransferase EpsN [Planomicrobium soli]|uniref:Pyridoxal phosphate-dependent aminotransferase EpsN n=1 Tax=Planomicrobium soli TaxID=1176648 RepID=A0A2P8H3J7_9BACL|nr:pyridoxal phosphate-dependent aminotransferase EpsN [Planomicrobium soli]
MTVFPLISGKSMESAKERIFLSTPHMTGNEMKYIHQAFETNWIAPLGPNVEAFERQIADYIGVKSSLAVSSGTSAIHLALQLIGVNPGDKVFCSTLTFVASANPILYERAEPVFIDSEEESWNMSPEALKKAFLAAAEEGELPKAVIIVHLYGQSAKMDELLEICNSYNVPVIEDAAESLGSTYKGKKSGSMGLFSIYSFNGNKIITSSGGGMLVSNDEEAVIRARHLATQAKDPAPYYEHSEKGFNYRLSNVLAGIGRAQLEVIENRVAIRRSNFFTYANRLGQIPGISFQPELEGTKSNRWLSVLLLDPNHIDTTPTALKEVLEAENIEGRHVWKPLHMQKLFAGCKFYKHGEGEAVSEKLFKYGFCLPSGSNMSADQQERVIDVLERSFDAYGIK